jgi:tRNA (cmo5U34)-methyltransferase
VSDNTTPHKATDYEREVEKTIPFHAELIAQAIEVGIASHVHPKRWLDTGAGPGRLTQKLLELAQTEAWIADPSEAMLALAKRHNPSLPAERFILAPSEALPDIGPFDVITAVQSHHYGSRDRAVARCYDLLEPNGVFIAFENVRAETAIGHGIQRTRWAAWQRAQGRDAETVQRHMAREDSQFFPIRPSEHLALYAKAGFRVVELFFRAYGQAGFYAVK